MNIFKNPKIALKHTEITLTIHFVWKHIVIASQVGHKTSFL